MAAARYKALQEDVDSAEELMEQCKELETAAAAEEKQPAIQVEDGPRLRPGERALLAADGASGPTVAEAGPPAGPVAAAYLAAAQTTNLDHSTQVQALAEHMAIVRKAPAFPGAVQAAPATPLATAEVRPAEAPALDKSRRAPAGFYPSKIVPVDSDADAIEEAESAMDKTEMPSQLDGSTLPSRTPAEQAPPQPAMQQLQAAAAAWPQR